MPHLSFESIHRLLFILLPPKKKNTRNLNEAAASPQLKTVPFKMTPVFRKLSHSGFNVHTVWNKKVPNACLEVGHILMGTKAYCTWLRFNTFNQLKKKKTPLNLRSELLSYQQFWSPLKKYVVGSLG